MIVYHATNLFSAEKARVSDLGLSDEYYRNLTDEIIQITKSDSAKVWSSLMRRGWYPMRSHYNEGVSFFPRKELCERIAMRYAKMGGEMHGSFVREVFKTCARFNRKKLAAYQEELDQYLREKVGVESPPCVITADVPDRLLLGDLTSGREIWTHQPIPGEWILHIEKINPITRQRSLR